LTSSHNVIDICIVAESQKKAVETPEDENEILICNKENVSDMEVEDTVIFIDPATPRKIVNTQKQD